MSRASGPFNRLTPAEDERLAWLLEEMGEALQEIGKIQRFGYDNSFNEKQTNRDALACEVGHVLAAIELMTKRNDITDLLVHHACEEKLSTVCEWLHHQELTYPLQPAAESA